MGKSNKKSATKGDSAPAVIKATEPLKKGKRETENDSETKVNLKKQKKDVVAAVVKLPKKVESDSSDSAVSEEELEVVPATNGSDVESDDDDVEDAMAEAETKESGSDDSGEESGDEEESD